MSQFAYVHARVVVDLSEVAAVVAGPPQVDLPEDPGVHTIYLRSGAQFDLVGPAGRELRDAFLLRWARMPGHEVVRRRGASP